MPATADPDLVTVRTDQFKVVEVQPGVGGSRRPLQAAQSYAELNAVTRSYGYIFEWVSDAFDFERQVVVAFNAPSNGCIPNVDRFDPHPGRTITPHFAPAAGPGGCDDVEQWPLYLVTIDRAAVAPWFVLELPGSDRIGEPPRRLRIDVQPAAAEAAGLRPVGWRLLTVAERVSAPRSLATDDTTLAQQWAVLGYTTAPPAVDLTTEVVLAFTVTDGGCGSQPSGVGLDDDLLTVLLDDPTPSTGAATRCTTDARPVSYLISLRRADLPDTVRIVHVPRDLGTEEVPTEVQLRS